MHTQIDFNDIPKNYLYCTHNKCPRHSKCLRYQAALCIPQTTPYYSEPCEMEEKSRILLA